MKGNMIWRIDYVVGNTYKCKSVKAPDAATAIKRAKVKNIVDIKIVYIGERDS